MLGANFQREGFTEKEKRSIEILEVLRRRGPISRPDIAQELNINVVTIANYVDYFIKHNLVYEKELDVSEGGRRPLLLDLNPQGGYIIGVGLNLTNMVGLLIDLKGNIILKTRTDRKGTSAQEVAKCLLEIIREIMRRSKDYTENIKGIGVGIAGVIDKKNGSIRWPERIDYGHTNYVSINVPLQGLIEKSFGLPVEIENDATAACFGEYWLQLEQSLKNILYMFSGVGCGIMVNGRLYTGSCGCAGEASVHSYKEGHLFTCAEGDICLLKPWETDLGITASVKSLLEKDGQSAQEFFNLTAVDLANIDLECILTAARANNSIACLALDKAAQRLGVKIAYLVNLLNPEAVVIGGGLEEAGERFLTKVNLTVKEWAFREATENLKVVYSQLRDNAAAIGAASLMTQKIFAGLL